MTDTASARWAANRGFCYKKSVIVAGFLGVLLLSEPIFGQTGDSGSDAVRYPLRIETQSGETHRFSVEYARKRAEKHKGLMFRTFLPADGGMLFLYRRVQELSMWMKNTYLPLDMVFIAPDESGIAGFENEARLSSGRIIHIVRETTPLSLESIGSGGEVIAVLELGGGETARRGIAVGDKIIWQRP